MRRRLSIRAAAFVVLAASVGTVARELPPEHGRSLSEIVLLVEQTQAGQITSIEFDDGFWELEMRSNGSWVELLADPLSGQVTRTTPIDGDDDVPPVDGIPLSRILRAVETMGRGMITEVEFDDRFWEIKLRRNGARTKLEADPMTGHLRTG